MSASFVSAPYRLNHQRQVGSGFGKFGSFTKLVKRTGSSGVTKFLRPRITDPVKQFNLSNTGVVRELAKKAALKAGKNILKAGAQAGVEAAVGKMISSGAVSPQRGDSLRSGLNLMSSQLGHAAGQAAKNNYANGSLGDKFKSLMQKMNRRRSIYDQMYNPYGYSHKRRLYPNRAFGSGRGKRAKKTRKKNKKKKKKGKKRKKKNGKRVGGKNRKKKKGGKKAKKLLAFLNILKKRGKGKKSKGRKKGKSAAIRWARGKDLFSPM